MRDSCRAAEGRHLGLQAVALDLGDLDDTVTALRNHGLAVIEHHPQAAIGEAAEEVGIPLHPQDLTILHVSEAIAQVLSEQPPFSEYGW